MGLLETAATTMVGGERRIASAARNITNANTPGYKREIAYVEVAERSAASHRAHDVRPTVVSTSLTTQGVLTDTGSPLDIAINGSAHLLVRDGDTFALTRGGQLRLNSDGLLVDALGRAVQSAGFGDISLSTSTPEITPDGTILEDGMPVSAIGMFDAGEHKIGASLTADQRDGLTEGGASEIRQGMVEKSNVTLSDEMVEMMRTQRQVESGAQLVRAYDSLMAQAISTFSRGKS